MKLLQDSYLDDLITGLKEKAARIHESDETRGLHDLETQLRFWFSKHYSIPMKSPILESYTIPEMLLEFYLHTYIPPSPTDVINDSRSELAEMMAKEFSSEETKFMDDVFGKDNSWDFKEE